VAEILSFSFHQLLNQMPNASAVTTAYSGWEVGVVRRAT